MRWRNWGVAFACIFLLVLLVAQFFPEQADRLRRAALTKQPNRSLISTGSSLRASLDEHLKTLYVVPQAGSEPKVNWEFNESVPFLVEEGSEARVSIQLHNDGRGPLRIFAVQTHCGCLGSSIEFHSRTYKLGDEIAVGESVDLVLILSPQTGGSQKVVGVDLLTNDPQFKSNSDKPFGMVELHPKFQAESSFRITGGKDSSTIDLSRYSADDGTSLEVSVEPIKAVTIESIVISKVLPPLSAEVIRGNIGSPWKVKVAIQPHAPRGPLVSSVDLSIKCLDQAATFQKRLYVIGRGEGPIRVDPPDGLHFGVFRETPNTKKLVFRSQSVRPLKIEKLGIRRLGTPSSLSNHDVDSIQAVQAHIDDASSEVSVTIGPGTPTGSFARLLVIDMSIPGSAESIEIPITGFIKE